MMNRARKSIALLSATLLLLMQAMPALAICNCDVPPGDSCCDAMPEPVATDTASCCSTAKADTTASDVTLTAHGCERIVVSSELPSVTVPSESQAADGALRWAIATPCAFTDIIDDVSHASPRHLRGPPSPPGAPLYVLNASYLI
jgi:hypothetical protein